MHKTSILLVDDEAIILNSLERELTNHGFLITKALSGEEAIDKLEKKRFNLVITDLLMTGKDGISVLKQAKKLHPAIGVIILTGYGDIKSAVDALRLGADDYLQKPCEIEDLLFRIDRCCENQNLITELKAQKDFLQNALDSLTHPFYVLDANDYTIKLANKAAGLGSTYQGKTCHAHIHGCSKPCDGIAYSCTLEEVKKNRAPVMLEHSHYTENEGEKLYEVHGYPVFDGDGNVSQIIEYCFDITTRKKMEEEQRRLVTAMEQSVDSIIITDKNGTILYINPWFEQVTGYLRHEVLGKNPSILQSGKHDRDFYDDMWQTLTQGKVWKGLLINKHKNGTLLEEESSIAPVFDKTGKIINYVAVKRDVTEQRKKEGEYRQAQKMEAIGALAGGIAHDFNNILSAIIGCAEFIRQEVPAESSIGKDVNEILVSGKRAVGLVKQILTFSRMEKVNKQFIRPQLSFKEAIKMLRATLPATVSIKEYIDPDCGIILADPTTIHQITVNLCTNALHSMSEEKGILSVALQNQELQSEKIHGSRIIPPGNYVVLTVSDTGSGMSKDTLEHAFEPYFTTKKPGRGTGLGLAVVHGIVEDCNGFIEVESTVGKGSTFSIFLPVMEKPPEQHTVSDKEKEKTSIAGSERILMVDDDPILVKINERRLKNHGYDVTAVSDSNEALEKFRNQPDKFDLLITDQTMPNLTGADLTKAVLEIKPSMPIIMCTGHSDTVNEKKALALGIKQYVYKPLHGDELLVAAREVLDQNEMPSS